MVPVGSAGARSSATAAAVEVGRVDGFALFVPAAIRESEPRRHLRHPSHCSASCTGAGLFSASAINSSNSSRRSGANRDTSDRQRITCSTAMASAFRFEGAFPVATAYAWPAMKVYQPCRAARRSSFLTTSLARFSAEGSSRGLVELPGPHLAQHALGKRFLRNLELRLRRRHHTLDRFRGRGGTGPRPSGRPVIPWDSRRLGGAVVTLSFAGVAAVVSRKTSASRRRSKAA